METVPFVIALLFAALIGLPIGWWLGGVILRWMGRE
jgi:hypothetical protein